MPTSAVRGFQTYGALDLGISFLPGDITRATLRPHAQGTTGAWRSHPGYDLIDQVGLDAQWTGTNTLLKLEAITRGGHEERIYRAHGEESSTPCIRCSARTGTSASSRRSCTIPEATERRPTLFDHDAFLGGRWAWNDVADTSVLGGPMVDLATGEDAAARSRPSGASDPTGVLGADARLFARTNSGSLMHGVRRDGFVSITATRYF